MILRRFMKHVTDQNWFAVGLDVIVVIVGIFLGLQITNWSDERAELAEEEEYLNRLHQDLDTSISINTGGALFLEDQIRLARFMTETLNSCDLPDESKPEFVRGLFQIGKRAAPNFTQNTLEELRSTGKFQYIRSVELREALIKHSEGMENNVRIDNLLALRLSPQILKIENYTTYNIPDENRVAELLKGTAIFNGNEIDLNMDELCGNTEVIRAISVLNVYSISELVRINAVMTAQKNIIELLVTEKNQFK